MQIGFVGLGRMGGNMVHRILRDSDNTVVAFDPGAEAVKTAVGVGATAADSLEDLVSKLDKPGAAWLMVPAGAITQSSIDTLIELLDEGDMIIDGGNSRWTESKAHAEAASAKGIEFVDVGTSGGVWGLEVGYCMMVGGSDEAVKRLSPILDVLAPPDGWSHMGPHGPGHSVKMLHNEIEYGLMAAHGEGFDILHASEYDLDLHEIARLWGQGSVVRSWLLELTERAFAQNGNELEHIRGYVEDSGEGRWTVADAIDHNVPAPVITLSLLSRFSSREDESCSAKVIAALRNQFGGHAVKSE
jgi:6-phosphogluconate dehydrogenase